MGQSFHIFRFDNKIRELEIYWLPVYIKANDADSCERLRNLIIASINKQSFIEYKGLELEAPYVSIDDHINAYINNYMSDMKSKPSEQIAIRKRVDQLKLSIKDGCLCVEPLIEPPDNTDTLEIFHDSISTDGINAPVYRILGQGPLSAKILQLWWA